VHLYALAARETIGHDFFYERYMHGLTASHGSQISSMQPAFLLGGFFPPPPSFSLMVIR